MKDKRERKRGTLPQTMSSRRDILSGFLVQREREREGSRLKEGEVEGIDDG